MDMRRFALLICLAFLVAACGGEQGADRQEGATGEPSEPASAATEQAAETGAAPAEKGQPGARRERAKSENPYKQAVSGDHRSKENRARDQYRHPAKTLAFFGLRPDMTVVELYPGGGWYTEILAPVLKENGHLTVAGFSEDSEVEYYRRSATAYNEKLAANPEIYGNVEQIVLMPPDQVKLGEPGSADMVLTFRNLHNWHERGTLADVFKAAYNVLKPGGVFGVVEHRAPEGTLIEEVGETGYMPEDYVINLAREIGFELDAKSDINANPNDTGDHPMGVWTLPPSLRYCNQMQDGAAKSACFGKYRQIGESDRMTLRFVKPTSE